MNSTVIYGKRLFDSVKRDLLFRVPRMAPLIVQKDAHTRPSMVINGIRGDGGDAECKIT